MDSQDIDMDRTEKLLFRVNRSMKILELGPSFSPLVPKSAGWNSWSVDHADAQTLREKYKSAAGVDCSKIESVDFVWTSGDLTSVIPPEHQGTFDCCIASHVIEHLPNPLHFFRSMATILRPSGIISLAIPDKRFCFDYFKPVSTTADVLYAASLNRTRHSKKTAFEQVAYGALCRGEGAWGQHAVSDMALANSLSEAKHHFDDLDEKETAPYVDHHAWYYTPSVFRLVVLELNVLGEFDWMIDVEFPVFGCEFYVTLRRCKLSFSSEEEREAERLALLKCIVGELAEQHGYLVQALAAPAPAAAPVESEPPQELPDRRPKRVRWRKRLKRMARSVLPRRA
jgi:SAM-dependent methyltransferase